MDATLDSHRVHFDMNDIVIAVRKVDEKEILEF